MAESNWMRHSIRLGLVGVRRRLRGLRRDRARLRLLSVSFACFVFVFTGMGALFALSLRTTTTPITIPTSLRVGVTFAWLFVVWYFSQQVLMYYRRLDNESFLLTTVSARTAVVSRFITDILVACIVLLLPTAALVGVVGYAFVQWQSIVLIPLATVLFAASATVVGYVVGFTYLHFSARSAAVDRTNFGAVMQILLRLVVIGLLLSVVTSGIGSQINAPALGRFTWLPTSWLIDLAALGTPTTASVIRASMSFLSVLVVVVVGGVVAERLATAYWYDASSTTTATGISEPDANDSTTILSETDVLATALSPLFVPDIVSTPVRRVAQVMLLRLRRAPRRLSFLGSPAITFVVILLVQTPNPLDLLPTVFAVAIPWLVGAAFGLNPLGDAGAVLPTILTSISGREFTRGLMTPGILYGLPLTIVCTVITGIFSPYSMIELSGLLVVGTILTVVAVVLAPAIGMRLPRFDTINIGQRSGILLPNLLALAIYTALVSILGRLATVTVLGSPSIDHLLASYGVSIGLFRFGGTMSVVIIALGIGLLSYNSVSARFTAYTFE